MYRFTGARIAKIKVAEGLRGAWHVIGAPARGPARLGLHLACLAWGALLVRGTCPIVDIPVNPPAAIFFFLTSERSH